MTVPRDYDST